jgi:DnaJ-domain-containing protein 1
MREKAEREARESQAGSDRARGHHSAPGENPWGEAFFGSDFASAFGFEQYNYFYESNSWRKEQPKTKASHKGRAPWYQVLGVQPNADKATIKSAWRKLASKYQPRTSAQALDKERTEKMKEINTAKDEGLKGLA